MEDTDSSSVLENANCDNDHQELEEMTARPDDQLISEDDDEDLASSLGTSVVTSLPQFYGNAASTDAGNDDNGNSSQLDDNTHGNSENRSTPVIQLEEVDEASSILNSVSDTDDLLSGHSRQTSLLSSSGLESNLDTPSPIRGSSLLSTSPRRAALHHIDRRFHTRLSSISSVRSGSSLRHSISQEIENIFTNYDREGSSPWESIRWTKFRKISNQIYSDASISRHGKPTAIFPAAYILVGTEKGYVLVFDYQQALRKECLPKVDLGAQVTSLAISTDQTRIAAGYSNGHIMTWDSGKSNHVLMHIAPRPSSDTEIPTKDAHDDTSAIIHLNFVGNRHSALVSADVKGIIIYHDAVSAIVGSTLKSRKIFGRYAYERSNKASTVLACAVRPLGTEPQDIDNLSLLAFITPHMLAIVSMLPHLRTRLRLARPKDIDASLGFSGCLAWFPASKTHQGEFLADGPVLNSRLAYSWSNVVKIIEVSSTKDDNNDDIQLNFDSTKKLVTSESIVSIQWLGHHVSLSKRRN